MQSFAFTDSLLAENQLESEVKEPRTGLALWLLGPVGRDSQVVSRLAPRSGLAHWLLGPRTRWKLYKIMGKRFDCDFSMRTGNLTMTFIDKDPRLARFVLQQYIDRLRNQLRNQEVHYSKLAIDSLEDEAARSPDPMLRAALYGIVAQELEQEKTAEMEADFAFSVIEAPMVPDERYSPWRIIDPLAAGVLSFLAALGYLYFSDRYRGLKREMDLASKAPMSPELGPAQERPDDIRTRAIT